jgi:hypothetical protein
MSKARDIASAIPAPSTVSSAELGYLDGVTSAIQTQVDAKIAKTLTTTTGDTIYASSANTPARLGVGSTGQVLTVVSGLPSWATLASSPIKQIVYAQDNTNTTVASTTYADTGLTATITPTSASSKILVFFNHPQVYAIQGTNSADMNWQIMRGATSIATILRNSFIQTSTSMTTERVSPFSYFWQDSPATTSATTYKTQFARGVSNVAMSWNVNLSSYSTMILVEI